MFDNDLPLIIPQDEKLDIMRPERVFVQENEVLAHLSGYPNEDFIVGVYNNAEDAATAFAAYKACPTGRFQFPSPDFV